MFTAEEIRIANATSRSRGASAINKDGSIRAIVPRYIAEHIDKQSTILDYGAGKEAIHTQWLEDRGFDCTAYDFGDNCINGIHNKNALSKQYKVVFASNVLNVQSNLGMFLETIKQIYDSLEPGGEFIANYPETPRKLDMSASEMRDILKTLFHNDIERVGGTKSAPLIKVIKPFIN